MNHKIHTELGDDRVPARCRGSVSWLWAPHRTGFLEKHLVKKKEKDALLLQSRFDLSFQTLGSLGSRHPSPSVS